MFFIPIHHVEVGENLGRGDQIEDGVFLTNQKDVIRSKLSARLTAEIGRLERDDILNSPLVAYGKLQPDPQSASDVEEALLCQLLRLQHFKSMLWLVKDNAASVEKGFVEAGAWVSARLWPGLCSMSTGSQEMVMLSRQELKLARRLYREAIPLRHFSSSEEPFRTEVVDRQLPRIARSLYFLAAARASLQLSVKIANYCSGFESLLLSEPAELAYRLAERAAWLLGNTVEERKVVFEQLKKAYAIRSKAIHGSFVSPSKLENDLRSSARVCDDLLRRLYWQIMQNPGLTDFISEGKGKPDDFEALMQAVTLGGPVPLDEAELAARKRELSMD